MRYLTDGQEGEKHREYLDNQVIKKGKDYIFTTETQDQESRISLKQSKSNIELKNARSLGVFKMVFYIKIKPKQKAKSKEIKTWRLKKTNLWSVRQADLLHITQ